MNWESIDILNILITNFPEVVSLWIAFKVIIDLVEKHTGNQLCVFCHGQLVWQFGNLTTHFEDFLQTYRTKTCTAYV